MLLGCTALRSGLQTFWSCGVRRHFPQWWGYASTPFPGWEKERLFQATLNSQKMISNWEGLRGTLSLGYEFIPLPIHNMGMLHYWVWLCFGGNQLCSPAPWLKHHSAAQLLGVVPSSSGQVGPEDTLHSSSTPCLGVGKPGSSTSKIFPLRIQIRVYTLPCSLVRVNP